MNFNWCYQAKTLKSETNRSHFALCDLHICQKSLKNIYGTHYKLCTSFQSHPFIQTIVAVRKRPNRVKIGDCLPRMTLNVIYDLEKHYSTYFMLLQSLCIISKPSLNLKWSCSPGTPISRKKWQMFVPRDLQIWRMAMERNMASLLWHFRLCASFHSHLRIMVRKCSNRGQICCHLFQPDLWPLTLTICMDITSVIAYYVWNFMIIWLQKCCQNCERQTDRGTDIRAHGEDRS